MKSLQPAKSGISQREVGNGVEWDVPAKRGVGCLMIFGCVFCLPPLAILGMMGFAAFSDKGEVSSWWGMLGGLVFLSIFFLAGGGIAYLGYRMRYTSHKVRVRDGAVEVVKTIGKKETSEGILRGNVHGVGLYSSSETNGKPNYGLMVKARSGYGIKFGSGLKEGELRWLASEMLGSLAEQGGLPSEEDLDEAYFSSDEGEGGDFTKDGVTVSLLGGEEFEVVKNGSKIGVGMIFGGLFGVVFGSIFMAVGFWVEDGPLLFGIVGSLIVVGAFVTFIMGLTRLGTAEKYTFKGDRVIKEKLRGGVSKSKVSLQKSDFSKVEVKNSGSSNNATRYSVVMKGATEKMKLFSWVDQEISDVVKRKLNGWLRPEVVRETVDEVPESSGRGVYGGSMSVERASVVEAVPQSFSPAEVPFYSNTVQIKDMKGGTWVLRIFLGVFLMAGLAMLGFGISNMITAKESESWPSVKGVVLTSKVSVNSDSDGTTYGADVTYKYVVDKQRYEGDRVAFGEVSTSSRNRAQKIVKRYRKGKKVAIFYDPNEPEVSVLEKGVSGGSWLLPGMGVLFFFVPLGILIFTERAHRKEQKQPRRGENRNYRHSVDSVQSRYGKVK
ncbi:MAG: DUF3592 domain-containing protein [Akkermansiaceae bacterium]